jgi:hypothetical protein
MADAGAGPRVDQAERHHFHQSSGRILRLLAGAFHIYTGEHIQFTAIFDNANSLWQADMSTEVKTIGHRMAELGYHAAYQANGI